MQATARNAQKRDPRNRLAIHTQISEEDRSFDALATEAQRLLATSPYRDLRSVECSMEGDTLVLSGRVRSYYEKQIAQTIVKEIEGLPQIKNQLEVVYHSPLDDQPLPQTVRKTK